MMRVSAFACAVIACFSGCIVGDEEPETLDLEGRGGTAATMTIGPEAIWAGSSFYVSGCGFPYNKQNPVAITLSVTGPQSLTISAGVGSDGCLTGASDLPAGPIGSVATAGSYAITASTSSNTGRITKLSTATFTAIAAPQATCQMQFTAKAPMPVAIQYPATAAVGTNVYSFGGGANGYYTTQAFRYDTTADTWTTLAPLPSQLELPGAASDGNYIYIVGAKDRWAGTTAFKFDPTAGTYTELATSAPLDGWAAQSNARVIHLDGKIYYFGGAPAQWYCTGYPNLAVLDLASNTWTIAAPFPNDFTCMMSSVAHNGAIYAAGGAGLFGGTRSAKTFRYDPAQNTWNDAAIADLPMPRAGSVSGIVNGQWMIAGGDANNSVLSWDPSANRWSSAGTLIAPRTAGAAVVGSSLYVVSNGTTGEMLQGSCK
jgi:N-acetylneuraminic acid mutarotase